MRRGPAPADAEADCDIKKTGPIKKSENSCFLKPTPEMPLQLLRAFSSRAARIASAPVSPVSVLAENNEESTERQRIAAIFDSARAVVCRGTLTHPRAARCPQCLQWPLTHSTAAGSSRRRWRGGGGKSRRGSAARRAGLGGNGHGGRGEASPCFSRTM